MILHRFAPLVAAAALAGSAEGDARTVTLEPAQAAHVALAPVELRAFACDRVATGRIALNDDRTSPVFTPWLGHVARLVAQPGDRVAAGDALAELDVPDLVQAECDLWAAQPGVAKARAAREHALRGAERAQRLYDGHAVALKDLEQARADAEMAASDVACAEAQLEATRARLRAFGLRDDEIAALERDRTPRRTATLRAPIAGTVVARKVGPGQLVRPDAADPAFTISDLSAPWLLADVHEADAAAVAVGQTVDVRVLALPDAALTARIAWIAPQVDATTRRVAVRCVIDDPPAALKPDMFASFRIRTGGDARTASVPESAVLRDGDRQVVWVADGDSRFARRAIDTGAREAGSVQVVSGLRGDERVVVAGALYLNDL